MAKPRELKRRIRSVQNTRKITKTMELVSTSKLKRAQDRVVGARPYAQALAEVIGELYSPELAERFPLLRQPTSGRTTHHAPRTALLLITSNRGLEDWPKFLGDVVVVGPLLDRLMHHGQLLKFEGKS